MPNPGLITDLHFPGGPGIRVDSHMYAHYSIPPFYDSLIAKLIAFGRNREESISRLRRSLDEFIVEGVKTTIPFHRKLVDHPDFIDGNFDTGFLDRVKFTD